MTREKKDEVLRSFRAIRDRYDLMNRMASFGIERRWRRMAVEALRLKKETHILDLCAGTMTVSADVARAAGGVRVTALDLCPEMLLAGRRRIEGEEKERIFALCSEGERIPAADAVFDGAIATYGVRNLRDPDAGIREVFRVLKPGGRFVILEFTRPKTPLFRALYRFYVGRIMPLAGALVTGSPEAYHYLARSIGAFMEPEELVALLGRAGFRGASFSRHTLGIVGLYQADKPGQG